MSNSLFCCATPRNVTGGVLEWVNRTTIHPFCGLAIDIPESRSLTNGVRHQAPSDATSLLLRPTSCGPLRCVRVRWLAIFRR